jgi:hypothetical protein
VTQGRKLLVLAGFAVLTAVAMGGTAPVARSLGRTSRTQSPGSPRSRTARLYAPHAPIEGRRAGGYGRFEKVQESSGQKGNASSVGVVQQLRPYVADSGDEAEGVNVVRLVEYLGPISPELALVDPELAARARALLPDRPGIRVPRRERDEPIPLRVAEVQVLAPAPVTRRRWRVTTVVAVAMAASAGFGFGVSAAASGEPEASAPSVPTTTSRPPVAPAQDVPAKDVPAPGADAPVEVVPNPKPPTKSPAGPAARVAPRFVWAPQADVTRYRFALYRGEQLIFQKDVTSPALEVPRTWTFRGRFYDLDPGRYRWVVWPYVSGKRLGPAIVSASYSG